jgi:hypothetical protein
MMPFFPRRILWNFYGIFLSHLLYRPIIGGKRREKAEKKERGSPYKSPHGDKLK